MVMITQVWHQILWLLIDFMAHIITLHAQVTIYMSKFPKESFTLAHLQTTITAGRVSKLTYKRYDIMLKKIAVLALGVALCAPAMAGQHKHYKKCHMTQRTGYVVVTRPVMAEVIVRPSMVREEVVIVKPVRYNKVVVMKPYGEFGYRYPRVVYYY